MFPSPPPRIIETHRGIWEDRPSTNLESDHCSSGFQFGGQGSNHFIPVASHAGPLYKRLGQEAEGRRILGNLSTSMPVGKRDLGVAQISTARVTRVSSLVALTCV